MRTRHDCADGCPACRDAGYQQGYRDALKAAEEVARGCGSDECPTPCDQLGHVVRCPHYIAQAIAAIKIPGKEE